MPSATDWFGTVVFGSEDPRVRATWRVLLAMPVLWVLTGAVLTGNLQSAVGAIPSGGATGSGVAASVLHGGFLVLALAAWARYVDREPLSSYGVSASLSWGRDAAVGFLAVVVGHVTWLGLSSVPGGTSVTLAPSAPEGSVLTWLVLPFVALVLHAAVQQVVFFRVILESAAEGLHSRRVAAGRAVLAAIPVAVVFFVAMHGSTTPLRILDLVIVGGIFGLLYAHSGALGLGVGAHFGAFFSGTVVFSLVSVTGSLSGPLGVVGQYGFPKMVLAYAVVLAWVEWRRGTVPVQAAIARWPGR